MGMGRLFSVVSLCGFVVLASPSCVVGESQPCGPSAGVSSLPCPLHLQCIAGWCLPKKFAPQAEPTPSSKEPTQEEIRTDASPPEEANLTKEHPKPETNPDSVNWEQPHHPEMPPQDRKCETEEQCDGKDNNCNGQIDENLTRPCYTGAAETEDKGECKKGTESCTNGSWSTCGGEILPQTESCDGKDNDCDGQIDEGCVVTIAGSGVAGYEDNQALKARFKTPDDLLFDNQENLYIADSSNHCIRKLDKSGEIKTIAGTGTGGYQDGPAATSQFNVPSRLAIDLQGNIYIADTYNHRIRKLDTQGKVTTIVGSGTPGYQDGSALSAQLHYPRGLVFDTQGNLLIADSQNHRIRKLDTNGNVTTLAGVGTPGTQDGPALSAQFDFPTRLTLDTQGNVYVMETLGEVIRKLDISGQVTTLSHLRTSVLRPEGLAFDSKGSLYIADRGNHSIKKFDSSQKVELVTGGSLGYKDGLFSEAQFNFPTQIKLDPFGNLWVIDLGNLRIRKLILSQK